MITLNFNDALADRTAGSTALLEFGGQSFDIGYRHRQTGDRRDTLACPSLDLPAHPHGRWFCSTRRPLPAHAFPHRPAAIGTQTPHSRLVNDARCHDAAT